MLKYGLVLTCILFGSATLADPVAALTSPRETVQVSGKAGDLVAYFERSGDLLDVTMLFIDSDGEILRSRVSLGDQQQHSVTLSGPEGDARTRYELERLDNSVALSVHEMTERDKLAVR